MVAAESAWPMYSRPSRCSIPLIVPGGRACSILLPPLAYAYYILLLFRISEKPLPNVLHHGHQPGVVDAFAVH